ncbi:hypothetical protein N7520_007130 [Penicillium odoratum]|uniref:uncharacterized protein n=1 Tax=Penicillium odoratum TaxID=1167516 RepID=UPI0025467D9E|nr:uncharacterized protein N7520_007130 [Penicillium odoratum]KAJ5759974.1 hypothetical protein N7520_007130 [Penicillium odoratum]
MFRLSDVTQLLAAQFGLVACLEDTAQPMIARQQIHHILEMTAWYTPRMSSKMELQSQKRICTGCGNSATNWRFVKTEPGDLALVDNYQVMYGRAPWTTRERKILVSIWDTDKEDEKIKDY